MCLCVVYVCVSIALVWLTFSRDDIWILSFSELYLVNLWDVDIGASALERPVLVIATAECNACLCKCKHATKNPLLMTHYCDSLSRFENLGFELLVGCLILFIRCILFSREQTMY